MTSIAADLLAAVELSPQAAAAHDRAGWVGLFTADGRVEDPVGSRAHVGAEQIGLFYDTFIGPRDIVFHRDLDVVCGSTVVRDLELEVAMGSAVTMHIPAILRYDLRKDDGQWRLARLRAYWELPAMMRQFLGNGAPALPAATQLSKSLLANQGLAGTAGFTAGFRRPGPRRRQLVQSCIGALAAGDPQRAAESLAPGAVLARGDDTVISAAELSGGLRGACITKILAAGDTVAVAVDCGSRRAVLFADVARRRNTITGISYFPAP